ncbi:MAG: hypothetical protein ACRC6M_04475, partial [Microcystaceae cyanobacterium]
TNLLFQLKQSSSFVKNSSSRTVLALTNSQSGEENESLKQAEFSLLSIYLHRPESRLLINECLETKDLIFSFSHHRLLWKNILIIQESFENLHDPTNQLLSKLEDIYLLLPDQMAKLEFLFHLKEKNLLDIENYELVIPDAIASLEKINWEKYSRYCQEQFSNLELMQEPEKVKYYTQEFINAQIKIKPLKSRVP